MDHLELFQQVEAFLKQHDYAWLLEQVHDELATGKITEERISTLSEVSSPQVRIDMESEFKKGQPAEFVKRAEYTPSEALALLLEAARRAIIDPSTMASEIDKALRTDGITELKFEPERGDTAPVILSFRAPVNQAPIFERASALNEIIQNIREN